MVKLYVGSTLGGGKGGYGNVHFIPLAVLHYIKTCPHKIGQQSYHTGISFE